MVRRVTTNGMMMSYKANLMSSYKMLGQISEKVTTQRNFNSYAESPAKASQAFQLRRERWNTETQITNSKYVTHKFQQAWNCMENLYQDLGNSKVKYSDLLAQNGTQGSGRKALGDVILGAADAAVQTLNSKFGERFIFSGADGDTVPFSWGENANGDRILLYRGMPVDEVTPELEATLKETTYVDLGMGMSENNNGELISSSAFNTAITGLDILGYGKSDYTYTDKAGNQKVVKDVPNNLVSVFNELGSIWAQADPDSGALPNGEEDMARIEALEHTLQEGLDQLHERYVTLDTQAAFVKTNQTRLEGLDDTLNEQIVDMEDIDPADAITSLMWAQYSYNAALRIGTNLLSQSLIDYMN